MKKVPITLSFLTITLFLPLFSSIDKNKEWKPVSGNIMTRWAKEVDPYRPHPLYPRPQMRRQNWLCLNGLWQYAIRDREQGKPKQYDGTILVPFPLESALSGVKKQLAPNQLLWYKRKFQIPSAWKGKKILLHIEASDWETTISINGTPLGQNRGGYSPFYLDITDVLIPKESQEITISVWDPCDKGQQPRGKQVTNPRSIWYTSVSGIWGSVWLEPVPDNYIKSVNITSDLDRKWTFFDVRGEGILKNVKVKIFANRQLLAEGSGVTGQPVGVNLSHIDVKPWSPDSPFLYDAQIFLLDGQSQVADSVDTYFGVRKIHLVKGKDGILRLFLNNRFIFQFGTLDQGWWPDGLYTAPNDEAMASDIEVLKELGFNLIRKHVKVEPRRYYYWCDKLGMLVWQDMPNGGLHIGPKDPDPTVKPVVSAQFEYELKNMVDSLSNHPSIIMWVIFNEGWGQYDTQRMTQWLKIYDSHRLVNSASGWTDRKVGDVYDIHRYPGPSIPPADPSRALVLGEFGGLGLPIPNHTWVQKKNWGYRNYRSTRALNDAYENLIFNLHQLIPRGLSAAVYTQTTDVESEVNGILTYDRQYTKFDPPWMRKLHQELNQPPVKPTVVVPTSRIIGQEWRYTTYIPKANWTNANFDDSSWLSGWAGFGRKGTPGATIRTNWESADIYLRTKVKWQWDAKLKYYLKVHHDDNARIFLNGHLARSLPGYTTTYHYYLIPPNIINKLKGRELTIAAHCHQVRGGQFFDLGIVSVPKKFLPFNPNTL